MASFERKDIHKESDRPKYLFIKSLVHEGRTIFRPLAGQWLASPKGSISFESVDTTMFVTSTDKSKRSKYPVGSVFCCDHVVRNGSYYETKSPYYLVSATDDKDTTPEMFDEYARFMDTYSGKAEPEPTHEESPKKRALYTTIKTKDKYKAPTIIDDGYYVDSDVWALLVRNVKRGESTLILGPTGTGKTEIVELLGKRLELPVNIQDMGSCQDPIASLLGVHRLNDKGVSVFEKAPFTHYVTSEGITLLDEASRAPSSANNILFSCLDSRKILPLDLATSLEGSDRFLKIHDECVFFATANLGVEYTGTQQMDRAFLDRFFPVEFNYMPHHAEVQVLQARYPGCSVAAAEKICGVANTLRDMYFKRDISSSISTRHTLACASLVADGFPLVKSIEAVFTPLFEGTRDTGERSSVIMAISSK